MWLSPNLSTPEKMFYKSILVTGGAGFIGSHTTLELLREGFKVVVADNLSNSSYESLKRVSQIVGCEPVFLNIDVRDRKALHQLFKNHSIDAVLHFAGLKAVGESVSNPLEYYDNNVHGSQVLLQAMADAGIFNFVFSSSATVYGEPTQIPISEALPVGRPANPYGRSKLMVEEILQDLAASDPRWRIAALRYFNPVGAHESGLIGENPHGVPNNLLPYLAQVAIGKLRELSVFGNDYPTKDGTGVRDYIHVMDLAEGHMCALNALQKLSGLQVWNLGTGQGYSVLEIIRAFENACGLEVPYKFAPRRPGDIATCYADPTKAERELGWRAKRDLKQMMKDAWHWQQRNPNGFD
ncbi:UDP-glucose 4-epimerase GalE [Limnobacter sp.]|uniref:UDP-glucose 4-epimerase GalE n=1 Tax=Limnobacter sp. TaxID=2003368 RepID=UPI003002A039